MMQEDTNYDGKNITLLLALWLTHKLWEWLSLNPSKSKGHWPEWVYNNGAVSVMFNHCPCCEYVTKNTPAWKHHDCEKDCPMSSVWNDGCGEPATVFTQWMKAHEGPTTKATLRIRSRLARDLSAAALILYNKEKGG